MKDFKDLLLKLFERFEAEDDESKWNIVGSLKPEDITRSKTHLADQKKIAAAAQVLQKKLESLKAQMEANHAEYWESLYSSYNLPREGCYAIDNENKIRMKPKHGSTCDCTEGD